MGDEQPAPNDPPAEDSPRCDRPLRDGSHSRASSTSRSIHSTRTLHSIDLETIHENGREYPNATYFMPCDPLEQTRLSIMHQVYLGILDGALTTAPIPPGVQRILDLGTGPGDWAVGMSQLYPDAEVVAVDLAVWDIEATEVAANYVDGEAGEIVWEIDDLDIWGPVYPEDDTGVDEITTRLDSLNPDVATEKSAHDSANEPTSYDGSKRRSKGKSISSIPSGIHTPSTYRTNPDNASTASELGWNFSEPFDFIHIRGMRGAFSNWDAVYRECYNSLAPGGWIEVVDFHVMEPGVTSRKAEGSAMALLHSALRNAAQQSGYPFTTTHLQVESFLRAGFDEISVRDERVPCGLWSDNEKERRVGKMWLVCMAESVEAMCLRLLTKQLGWSVDEVRELCTRCTNELLDNSLGKILTTFTFVRARRPLR